MTKRLMVMLLSMFAVTAFAQAPAAKKEEPKKEEPKKDAKKEEPKKEEAKKEEAKAPAMDMSKVGPWSRKPTNEKATKKEIEDFLKKEDELAAKGDMDGMLGRIDFPVYMVTDDATGKLSTDATAKDKYVAEMKPFYENMAKDTKYTHKWQVSVLSDSLAVVVDDFTMSSGKNKMGGRNASILAKVDGAWKFKTMVEAGWGGMGEQKK